MNIVMLSLDFPPTIGGIAAHVYELSKALSQLGHTLFILTRKLPSMTEDVLEMDHMQVFRFRLKYAAPLYGWQINRYVQRKLDVLTPDIIHIHGMAPLEGYRIEGIPLVYTNHTSGYLKRIEKGGFRRMALIRRLFKKPDLFLAPSRELLKIPFEISAKKQFIPNGVDAQKYVFRASQRESIRKKLDLAPDDILGILTRRLVEKNGVMYLARATRYIRHPKLKLLIIGDGEEKRSIERELSTHFKNRFFMLGAKTHNGIIPYYSAADFSILPSLMEATSISGLEAMATSLPLVGCRVGGIPELIVDGENGFLCHPADEKDLAEKIDTLLFKDLKKMGARSRKRIEDMFQWPRIAQQTLDAYMSVQ
jgi:glycosyltransferase involved in cell wall biosynthesis